MRIEGQRLSSSPYAEMEALRELYGLLLFLCEDKKKYTPRKSAERLSPAVRHIALHYAEDGLTNEYLASLCGMSEVYFRKLFLSVVGASPNAYLQGVRMQHAKDLLESDFASVTHIAECVGYHSIYHFSKMFKRHFGISPSEYVERKKK